MRDDRFPNMFISMHLGVTEYCTNERVGPTQNLAPALIDHESFRARVD